MSTVPPFPSTINRRAWLAGVTGTLAAPFGLPAWAAEDDYPNRSVRLVMPYAAGGAGDVVTRLVANQMSAILKQPFVVENRPGAGGATGAIHVAKSTPDGYTVAFAAIGYNLMNIMQPGLQFDPGRDLAPIGFICNQPYALLTRPDAPWKNVAELVSYAKAHPGEVRLAHAGVGTLIHLFGAWLAGEAKVSFNEIPYTGSAPALNSLLAGQTDIYFDPPSNSLGQVKAGKLRVLATTGTTRLEALKEYPTLRELGYAISGTTWFGLMAPKDTPRPIIDKLNTALNTALRQDDVKQRLEQLNYTAQTMSPDEFGKFFMDQTALWTKIIRDNNVKVPT